MRLGLNLQPDPDFLRRTRRIAEDQADFFEVSPETLWRSGPRPAKARSLFLEMRERSGKPFVGHGLFLSPGTAGTAGRPAEDARLGRWLKAIAADHAAFDFEWYSEHLGFLESGGLYSTLPLPLPLTEEARDAAVSRLRRLGEVVPRVAFENWASSFALGPVEDEPAFFRSVCEGSGAHLLLDLHNVLVQCGNAGADPDAYVDALPLDRVLCIHLSGGRTAPAEWTRSPREFRLDSHDGPVPEWAWTTLERIQPRCPLLEGVVIERLAEGLDDEQVPQYEAEFQRARDLPCWR